MLHARVRPDTDHAPETAAPQDLDKANVRRLIGEAVKIAGSEAKLGAACGVTQTAINKALRVGRVSGDLAVGIERATGAKIARGQLRPDLFGDMLTPDQAGRLYAFAETAPPLAGQPGGARCPVRHAARLFAALADIVDQAQARGQKHEDHTRAADHEIARETAARDAHTHLAEHASFLQATSLDGAAFQAALMASTARDIQNDLNIVCEASMSDFERHATKVEAAEAATRVERLAYSIRQALTEGLTDPLVLATLDFYGSGAGFGVPAQVMREAEARVAAQDAAQPPAGAASRH